MTPQLLERIRAEFPALAGDTVFLDNAGGSQVLQRVADRVRDYLLNHSVQLGASYAASQVAGEQVLAARRALAGLLNAPFDDEVVIGPSTTALVFLLTHALAPQAAYNGAASASPLCIRPGDEIIVTETDHEAHIGGWMRLAQAGAVVKVWRVDTESLTLDLAGLDRLLSSRTAWVAMTWASNILGTVNPVADVAQRVHAVGGRLCVDAVAYAPHRLIDVQDASTCGADAVLFSVYKVFGPHLAVLWMRRELLLALPSLNHDFIGPEVLPYKLQPGNLNYELSVGCIGIHAYLCDTGRMLGVAGAAGPRAQMQAAFDAFEAHENALAEQLLAWLRGQPRVRIIGRPSAVDRPRVPTISFTVQGLAPAAVVRHIDRFNIGIRHGDFYARRLIQALGLQDSGGVVRVSMAHYNTAAEVERLVSHLQEVIA